MNTTNFSSKLLGFILCGFALVGIYKGYSISSDLHQQKFGPGGIWLIGQGPYFEDTTRGTYQHLVTDFTLNELLPRLENQVIIDGYENGKKYVGIEIINDTLYVHRLIPDNDTTIVRVNDDYALRVQIGASRLKSITLNKGGKLDVPALPYGSHLDGEEVYKPEIWEKYVLKTDELDLYLNGYASSKLFTEVKNLNIIRTSNIKKGSKSISRNFTNGRLTSMSVMSTPTSPLEIIGSVEHLKIIHPQGPISLKGQSLNVDSLTVLSNPGANGYDSGSISVNCSTYLEAKLRYDLDIYYVGEPEMAVTERGYGRVIKKRTLN